MVELARYDHHSLLASSANVVHMIARVATETNELTYTIKRHGTGDKDRTVPMQNEGVVVGTANTLQHGQM